MTPALENDSLLAALDELLELEDESAEESAEVGALRLELEKPRRVECVYSRVRARSKELVRYAGWTVPKTRSRPRPRPFETPSSAASGVHLGHLGREREKVALTSSFPLGAFKHRASCASGASSGRMSVRRRNASRLFHPARDAAFSHHTDDSTQAPTPPTSSRTFLHLRRLLCGIEAAKKRRLSFERRLRMP